MSNQERAGRPFPGKRYFVGAIATLLVAVFMAGCGTPGAPLPPTLKLPRQVSDLSAARSADNVELKWTMPKRSTDALLLVGPQTAVVWRTVYSGPNQDAVRVALKPMTADPAATATFSDHLPADLTAGPLRRMSYQVELTNLKGQSAGMSNAAESAAGAAPGGLDGLHGEATAQGIALHWKVSAASGGELFYRIHRVLHKPQSNTGGAAKKNVSLDAGPGEAADQVLIVAPKSSADPGGAMDVGAPLNRTYTYTVERVVKFGANGHTVEVAGPISDAAVVDARDIFPPKPPADLAAIAVPEQGVVDLSWTPNTEPDLAGYIVYRRESAGGWVRISPVMPVVAPAFRDTAAQRGAKLSYAVSAVDTSGNESARSTAADETLPQ